MDNQETNAKQTISLDKLFNDVICDPILKGYGSSIEAEVHALKSVFNIMANKVAFLQQIQQNTAQEEAKAETEEVEELAEEVLKEI
jgi:hypothetical protein